MKNTDGQPFQAYLGCDKEAHKICSECPDRAATIRLVESLEQKRQIAAAFHGYIDQERKRIQYLICDDCIARIEDNKDAK